MSEVKNADPTKTVDRVEFDSVYGAFAYTKDGKNWRLSGEEIARALNAQPIVAAQCAPQPSGEHVREAAEDRYKGEFAPRLRAAFIEGAKFAAPPAVSCAAREALVEAEAKRRCLEDAEISLDYLACQDRRFRHDDRRPWWQATFIGRIEREIERLEKAGFTVLPAAGGEASKREAEIVERHAKLAESLMHSDLTPGRVGLNIAAAIRASLRKDG